MTASFIFTKNRMSSDVVIEAYDTVYGHLYLIDSCFDCLNNQSNANIKSCIPVSLSHFLNLICAMCIDCQTLYDFHFLLVLNFIISLYDFRL